MQEEIEKKTANVAIQTSKLSIKDFYRARKAYNAYRTQKKREKSIEQSVPTKGKQSVKELIGQGQGVSSVDIADAGLKDF